uniref:NADH dehydrogenase subunit 6 n=1 Tax=Epizoanthus ramosus TaxID=760129 RepID=UPI002551F3C3|nr:NADH dehydrogenase subunit 6 [Epizoanthus ramosus]YP_010868424.1 NADH dehydrogenase subunit 6 [Epizoanthus rinbou]WGU19905.1 NADH dehydrogenase subunit 6 [Epizoanthus ramosus]WGU19918.1 NADH dehydrogenase subunit 6 [Epizoanthus rinbou]
MAWVCFYTLSFGTIASGIMVISALNPVHSVFWLVVAFTSSSALFILLGVDFIALMFLIVYVGAIAILFLFVIMMLNLTDFPPAYRLGGETDMTNYVPVGLAIGTLFFSEIASSWLIMGGRDVLTGPFGVELGSNWNLANPWFLIKCHNIEAVGRLLYTDYYYLFILASFILLVAMIGAIVLTQEIGEEIGPTAKKQDIFFQTSRAPEDG